LPKEQEQGDASRLPEHGPGLAGAAQGQQRKKGKGGGEVCDEDGAPNTDAEVSRAFDQENATHIDQTAEQWQESNPSESHARDNPAGGG
jgi:hypothetical protein